MIETPRRQKPNGAEVTIVLLLVAVVLLVAVILTQVHLDNEPYPCTPTSQAG